MIIFWKTQILDKNSEVFPGKSGRSKSGCIRAYGEG
jgi:hypothetical protein